MAANMIGAGVFLSAGFMARDLGPGAILGAWALGSLLACAGAVAYGAAARAVGRSGGEYRLLSSLVHPALGYLAGWTSLLVGFSAPIAVNALAAGSYAHAIEPRLEPRGVALVLLAALSAVHARRLALSARAQNALVTVKAALLVAFVGVGLALGSHAWPGWRPIEPERGLSVGAFATALFFVAFAYSGWNAAAYAYEEFREPARNVPRAMLLGCGLVSVLYLLVNWVLVANLTPRRANALVNDETRQATLGHLVLEDLAGPAGATAMSLVVIVAFVSAMSAMTFAGPRVYAEMARDGFLPAALAGSPGRPPTGSVLLQGALAALLVLTQGLRELLAALGGVLTFFAAATCLGLLTAQRGAASGRLGPRPPAVALVAAAVYAGFSTWLLYHGFRQSRGLLVWLAAGAVAGLLAYAATRGRRSQLGKG